MECRRRVITLLVSECMKRGSWGMEVMGVWGGCPASFCRDNIFGHLVTWVLQTNPHQQSSNFVYITNPEWIKNNWTHFVFLYLIKTGTSRESRDIYLLMFLDRKLRGVADGAGFLWVRGIQGVFSCPLPTANSVALSLPFGVFGSASAISPLLFKLNLRKSTWIQLVLIQQKLVCTKIEHM